MINFILSLFVKYSRKFKNKISAVMASQKGYYIHYTAIMYNEKNIILSKNAEIWEHVLIRAYGGGVVIGENSQIGPHTVLLDGDYGIRIGDNVMIGPHCVLAAGNHEYRNLNLPMRFAGSFSEGPIVIEEDVWIGANCTITDNVKISKGAIIGANSMVNKNVNEYDIVAGNPAKKINSRIKE